MLPSGELLIRDVRTEDSYVPYRCVTRNDLTGEERTSDPATPYVIGNASSINSGLIPYVISMSKLML